MILDHLLKVILGKDLRERPPFKAMILFVSTPNPNAVPVISESPEIDGYHAKFEARDRITGQLLSAALKGGSAANLEDDICLMGPLKHNWQQLLRSIRNREALDEVWLIGSKEANGSGSHSVLGTAARLLQPYVSGSVNHAQDSPSFEDFDGVVEAVRSILRGSLRNVPREQIVLDVTGGQKVTSIAGAALTMNNELCFQYVQTNPPFATRLYDVIRDEPPHLHAD